MVSFCDAPVIGYHPNAVTFEDLTPDDLVRLLVQTKHSRRAVKRFLHDRNMPSDSAGVDAAIAQLESHRDFQQIQVRASTFAPAAAVRADTAFDPIADVRRELLRLSERPGDFAKRVERDTGIPFAITIVTLEGRGDPPLSVLKQILTVAGVTRLYFGANRRPRRLIACVSRHPRAINIVTESGCYQCGSNCNKCSADRQAWLSRKRNIARSSPLKKRCCDICSSNRSSCSWCRTTLTSKRRYRARH